MGSWAIETYFKTADVAAIASSLAAVLSRDGYQPIARPSRPECEERDQRSFQTKSTDEPLWGAVILPGSKNWSYIICNPAYVLAERAAGSKRPRLADVGAMLKVDAFMLAVFDSCDAALLEYRRDGEFRITGGPYDFASFLYKRWGMENPPPDATVPCFDEQVPVSQVEPQFSALKEMKRFNPALNACETAATLIGSSLSGVPQDEYIFWSSDNRPFCAYRRTLDGDMIPFAEIAVPRAREIYFRRE